jgi:hypothetical protein
MVSPEGSVELPASITRAEPPHLLEYTWGPDRLEWRLERLDSGTRLTLRHTVETPDLGPKVAAGWHLCLVVADRWLAGNPIGRIVGEDAMGYGWPDLHDQYAVLLESEERTVAGS